MRSDGFTHSTTAIEFRLGNSITAALDAAEQRGREKALEEAAKLIEESGEHYINSGLAAAIRAMKGDKK